MRWLFHSLVAVALGVTVELQSIGLHGLMRERTLVVNWVRAGLVPSGVASFSKPVVPRANAAPEPRNVARTVPKPRAEPIANAMGPLRIARPRQGGPGVELHGIRPGTLPALLGLSDGDVLLSVNGHDVATPAGAMRAFMALRTAPELDVAIERMGRPVRLRLHLL